MKIRLYLAKILYYDEYKCEEKTAYEILAATSFSDAMSNLSKDWGEDSIIETSLFSLGDDIPGSNSILISKSLAEALRYGIAEDIFVPKTKYQIKMEEIARNADNEY